MPPQLGDLTQEELDAIQSVVELAGRQLEVVGSAARGCRRAVGSGLPLGKGIGTQSDIDYLVAPSNLPFYQGLESYLPGLDAAHGIVPGLANPYIGPTIRFEPGSQPSLVPAAKP